MSQSNIINMEKYQSIVTNIAISIAKYQSIAKHQSAAISFAKYQSIAISIAKYQSIVVSIAKYQSIVISIAKDQSTVILCNTIGVTPGVDPQNGSKITYRNERKYRNYHDD